MPMEAVTPATESAERDGVNGLDPKSHGEKSMEIVRDSESIDKDMTWDMNLDLKDVYNIDDCGVANAQLLPVVFRWNDKGDTVLVSGSYDNWKSKIPLVKSQDDFYAVVEVPEGTHQYKYIVNGEWRCHPNEPMVENEVGCQNNVITIQESDCDMHDILYEDIIAEGVRSRSHQDKFSQYIPPKEMNYSFMRTGPPVVPPHLLETILDKDVPACCEPTLVAEPTHVVLNHLYTLSIKDGVMVMSSTHRYRKKYITTLLYTPTIK